MTRVRGLEGLPVGRMVADTSGIQRYAPPAATCERCGCRLSRYRDAWESACAACQRILVAEGSLVVPDFVLDVSGAMEAQAAALALDTLLCKTCSRPLAKGGRPSTSGLCRGCLNKKNAAKKPPNRCGGCGITVNQKTAYMAQRERRKPRCRDCYAAEVAARRAAA